MSVFVRIDGCHAVVINKGVMKQCGLYEYKGYICAKIGSGYVYIIKSSFGLATSSPNARIEDFYSDFKVGLSETGRLCLTSAPQFNRIF